MKMMHAVQQGARYLCTKLGAVVTAVQQVAIVKGLPMWEVERVANAGSVRRMIVPARSLVPIPSAGQ